jgi:hypothetical protein
LSLTNYNIKINGADFSSAIAAVTFDISAAEQETTAFGNSFRVERIAGLKDASVSLDFHQDFGATAVDATLFPLIGSAGYCDSHSKWDCRISYKPVIFWRVP